MIMFNGEKPRNLPEQIKPELGKNINAWAEVIRDIYPDLSKRLNQDRLVGFENIEKLGLPTYKRKTMGLRDYLNDPEKALSNMDCELYYIVLNPKEQGLRRYTRTAISPEQLAEYIPKMIGQNLVNKYEIIINQHFENQYGGNIVVDSQGQIYAEFKTGDWGQIGKGSVVPEFYVATDESNTLKYSFEDEKLRRDIYRVFQTIPHTKEERETRYHPGYYEFVLVKRDPKSLPEPIFVDYKDSDAYQLPEDFGKKVLEGMRTSTPSTQT